MRPGLVAARSPSASGRFLARDSREALGWSHTLMATACPSAPFLSPQDPRGGERGSRECVPGRTAALSLNTLS